MKFSVTCTVLVILAVCQAQRTNPQQKPGQCPKPAPGSSGICVNSCKSDQGCKGSQKCCSNGCGRVCMQPNSTVGTNPCAKVNCGPRANCTVRNGQARCVRLNNTGQIQGCIYGGARRPNNSTFRSKDGCNKCICRNGSVLCTKRVCPTATATTTMKTTTGCTYNGMFYRNNSTFTAKDGCNKCFCRQGHILCTLMGCLPKGCMYAGARHPNNSTFRSSDGCNRCNCINGTVICTKKVCPTSAVTVTPYSKNPCQNHTCQRGGVCKVISNKAQCGCIESTSGKFYRNGQGFRNPSGCGTCYCSGGKVRCPMTVCPTQAATHPPNPCQQRKCPLGTTCKLQTVQCVKSPCNPVAVCVNTTSTRPTGVSSTCPPFRCHRNCSAGYLTGRNGCKLCQCQTSTPSVTCSPIRCLMLCMNGFEKDSNGCEICKCKPNPTRPPNGTCAPIRCRMFCPYGYVKDQSGCSICQCVWPTRPPVTTTKAPAVTCSPVRCRIYCRYGFAKDENGCEICRCNPAPTKPRPTCSPVLCLIYCQYGYVTDKNGCPICRCNPPPTGMTTTMAPTATPGCPLVFCPNYCPDDYVRDERGCVVKNCSCITQTTASLSITEETTSMTTSTSKTEETTPMTTSTSITEETTPMTTSTTSGCTSALAKMEDCFSDPDINRTCKAASQAWKCYQNVIDYINVSRCTPQPGLDTQASELRQEVERLCSATVCSYGGATYPDGSSFPAADGCNYCACIGTEVVCEENSCSSPKFCAYGGKQRNNGQTFRALDECNNCSCLDGVVRCTKSPCATTHYLEATVKFNVEFNQLLPETNAIRAFANDFITQAAVHLQVSPSQVSITSIVNGSVIVTFTVQSPNLTVVVQQLEELLQNDRFTIEYNAMRLTAVNENFFHKELLGVLPAFNDKQTSSPDSSGNNPSKSGDSTSVNIPLIAGSAVGGFVAAILLAIAVAYAVHHKRSRKSDDILSFATEGNFSERDENSEVDLSNPLYGKANSYYN